jgi:hypothetical protein
MKFFLSFGFENAYMKAQTFYKWPNSRDVLFGLTTTILPHKCFVKQACLTHFVLALRNKN